MSAPPLPSSPVPRQSRPEVTIERLGNKAIALKLCRNVLLRDITILRGGHFAILTTGVDNLTVDNVTMDTNRDGIDVDWEPLVATDAAQYAAFVASLRSALDAITPRPLMTAVSSQ